MLNYQNEYCDITLREGIDEYRDYLKKNNRHVLGENCFEDVKLTILGHDATHVIFGLDASLEEEAMLDCWVSFGGGVFKVLKEFYKGFNIFASVNPDVAGGFEHQGYFALIDKKGYIRSRVDKFGNPIVYYLGIDQQDLEAQGTDIIIEDIRKLLKE